MSAQKARLLLDVDMGVDDAVAVGWLLAQEQYPVSVVGITAVAGNTTVANVTRNVSALLAVVGETGVPLVQGAAAPRQQPLGGTAAGVHGADGLWFAARDHLPAGAIWEDAPAFIAEHAAPDVTLVALGPLTNVANAWRRYPERLAALKEIIILGGARCGGNRTPVSEFNIWTDPEAASEVLASGLPLTMVPLDAFAQFTLTSADLDALSASAHPVAQFLAAPLRQYTQIQVGRGRERFTIPDVVAIFYTLDRSLGRALPALVQVVPGIEEESSARLLRGQTIVGLTPDEKLAMLAGDRELSELAQKIIGDPTADIPAEMGAILARGADAVQVVLEVEAARMRDALLQTLIS